MKRRSFIGILAGVMGAIGLGRFAPTSWDVPPPGLWNVFWEPDHVHMLYPREPTLLAQVKATDPEGALADIVEALSERNPILSDAIEWRHNKDDHEWRGSEPS